MKFYDCATAPSPRRVRIFLAEKGIRIETVQIDLRNGEQFTPAFRAINPDCTVPALALADGTVIPDAIAICTYLEELHPEPVLIGSTPRSAPSPARSIARSSATAFLPPWTPSATPRQA
jgi:glutathione S-transferase